MLSDLHRRANNHALAEQYRIVALESAPSSAVQMVLERRLRVKATHPDAALTADGIDPVPLLG